LFTKNVKSTIDDQKICIKLRFIDSYKFLIKLNKLTSFLSKDKLKILQREFPNLSVENFDLLTRRASFRTNTLTAPEKMEEKCLPPRGSFYSSLTSDTISENDYAHAAQWEESGFFWTN